jgi:hypothetical protein
MQGKKNQSINPSAADTIQGAQSLPELAPELSCVYKGIKQIQRRAERGKKKGKERE